MDPHAAISSDQVWTGHAEQFRQSVHAVEGLLDEERLPGSIAGAGITEAAHARCPRGAGADHAVLHDDAIGRRDAAIGGGLQIDVRHRLRAAEFLSRIEAAPQPLPFADPGQHDLHLAQSSVGADDIGEIGAIEPIQHGREAADDRHLPAQHIVDFGIERFEPVAGRAVPSLRRLSATADIVPPMHSEAT